ncbi:hypothetical protein HDU96_003300 [Phlyctochytrium bullatum]|nr:hypothetical protein HDU96_003300 [Phlyctochytrium bullatum]
MRVQVRVASGKNLSKKDLLTSNDSYCEVWIGSDSSKKQTTGIVRSNSPAWNETFTLYVNVFEIPSPRLMLTLPRSEVPETENTVTFRVLDKDEGGIDDGVGYAQFNFEHLKAKKRTSENKELALRANLLGLDLTANGYIFVEVVVL